MLPRVGPIWVQWYRYLYQYIITADFFDDTMHVCYSHSWLYTFTVKNVLICTVPSPECVWLLIAHTPSLVQAMVRVLSRSGIHILSSPYMAPFFCSWNKPWPEYFRWFLLRSVNIINNYDYRKESIFGRRNLQFGVIFGPIIGWILHIFLILYKKKVYYQSMENRYSNNYQ